MLAVGTDSSMLFDDQLEHTAASSLALDDDGVEKTGICKRLVFSHQWLGGHPGHQRVGELCVCMCKCVCVCVCMCVKGARAVFAHS